MSSILYIAKFTSRILVRDKIFLPAAIIGLLLLSLAGMVSGWTVENYERVLYDIGLAGFHFIGAVVALLWGAKIIGDFRSDGSIELELAAPINRIVWFIGKALGLIFVLFILGGALLGAWQLVLYFFDFKIMETKQLVTFLFFVLEWWVIAALAFFFSSFSSTIPSMFLTFVMVVVGLISEPIYVASRESQPGFLKDLIGFLADFWNLQRFNLSDVSVQGVFPNAEYLLYTAVYGFSLIAIFLFLGGVIFIRRQIQ